MTANCCKMRRFVETLLCLTLEALSSHQRMHMHEFITAAKENSKLNMWNILTVHNQTMLYTHTKSQFCAKRSLNLFLEKEDSLGFWIPCHGFHTLSAELRIRTSNRYRNPGFLELYSEFQSQRFRIPQGKISLISNSKSENVLDYEIRVSLHEATNYITLIPTVNRLNQLRWKM